MRGKIFISYRRDDAAGDARGIRDGLARTFGKANVFMDIDNLLAGQRFDRELEKALERCDVLIAVIGPRWMEQLAQRTASGERDYVCEEIAAALRRGIVVIPVRAGHEGRMPPLPRPADLPEPIRDLVQHQKHDVMHEHFGRDMADLVAAIRIVQRGERAPLPWKRIAAAGVIVLLFGAGVFAYQAGVRIPWLDFGGSQSAADAQRQAEEEAARRKAEEEARKRAEEEARRKAEEEARKKAEEEARKKHEEEIKREPALAVAPGSGESFRDRLASGEPCPMCPELLVVPGGSFTMGSPEDEPGRDKGETELTVALARPFAVGKFAVTVDEFEAFVQATGYQVADTCFIRTELEYVKDRSFRAPGFAQDGRHPAVCVDWNGAKQYVAWLTKLTGRDYRLLSEAEREYVTRAGATSPFWWGSYIAPALANYDGRFVYAGGGAKGDYRRATVPVDSFAANPWGLFNVHGNIWEWAEDCWNAANAGNPGDGTARAGDCSRRVLRGGSWEQVPESLRSASRSQSAPEVRANVIGFRVGRSLAP